MKTSRSSEEQALTPRADVHPTSVADLFRVRRLVRRLRSFRQLLGVGGADGEPRNEPSYRMGAS